MTQEELREKLMDSELYKRSYDEMGMDVANKSLDVVMDLINQHVAEEKDELLHRVTPLRYASLQTVREFLDALEQEICTKRAGL